MNWIFPIAGFGTRTQELGPYKPLLLISEGNPLIKICLLGLKTNFKPDDTLVFVSTEPFNREYAIRDQISNILKEVGIHCNTKVVLLESTPPGQALTIQGGIEALDGAGPVMVVNIDQFVYFDISSIKPDIPSVGIYFNDGTKSCFYDLDITSGRVVGIKEKEKISCYASSGVFYFPSVISLSDCIKWGIDQDLRVNGELYLSPCLNYFDNLGYFKTDIKFDLGDVNQIKNFDKFWCGLKSHYQQDFTFQVY